MENKCIQLSPLDVLTIGSDLELVRNVNHKGVDFKVSSTGEVWACEHTDPSGARRKEKQCQQVKSPNGYRKIGVKRNYKSICILVHRLVAKAFLDDYCEELQVDHINRVRHDNRLINLRMVTSVENIANAARKKHFQTPNGTDIGRPTATRRKIKGGECWQSRIRANGKYVYFGTYKTKERAMEIALLNGLNL